RRVLAMLIVLHTSPANIGLIDVVSEVEGERGAEGRAAGIVYVDLVVFVLGKRVGEVEVRAGVRPRVLDEAGVDLAADVPGEDFRKVVNPSGRAGSAHSASRASNFDLDICSPRDSIV